MNDSESKSGERDPQYRTGNKKHVREEDDEDNEEGA